jgi:hypothetical protein
MNMRLNERVHTASWSRALATATTNASRHHAVMSSIAAQVIAIEPSRVRCNPRSVRMRASTGNAVTDIEMPMKSANTANGTSLLEKAG